MELRQLRYFVAVAEELHFGRAAARLAMAQPPLSQQIRKLEDELGFRLFDRNRTMVRLTDAGRSLLLDARRMLTTLEEATAKARLASGGDIGRLRIGFVGSPKVALLNAIKRHRESADIYVSLEEVTFDELIAGIYDDRIDLGVFRQWMPTTAIHTAVIDTGTLSAAIPVLHPLAKRESIELSTLSAESFVGFKRTITPGYQERLSIACAEAGFVPKIEREVLSAHSALCFVAAGAAVAIVPESTAELSFPGVTYRPVINPSIEVPIVAAWRPESNSIAVHDFVRLIARDTR